MSDKKVNNLKSRKHPKIVSWNILKRYLANSSTHGVRYLVEDHRHWSERVFWLTACVLSWWGCGVLISSTIKDFITHKVDITMDTNYLNWEIEFPAIHLCFYFSGAAKDYAANITGIGLQRSSTVVRLTKWAALGYDGHLPQTLNEEQFLAIEKYIKPNCTDVFGTCEWNDEIIDCCELFFPIATNLGQCLSFNSIFTKRSQNSTLPKFVTNHHEQKAIFTLSITQSEFWNTSRDFFYMLLTDSIEYPSRSSGKERYLTAKWSKPNPTIWDIMMMPTHNDAGVVSLPYNERKCRFSSETDGLRLLKFYSYHGCIVETQMKRSVSLCGCISHLYPSSKSYRTCNYTELRCVFDHKKEIVDDFNNVCLPDCKETKITSYENVLSDDNFVLPKSVVTKLIFNMLPGPFVRYNRYTVHSLLDVVVSVGGTLGLFAGASVLSLVELFYWLLIRHDDTE